MLPCWTMGLKASLNTKIGSSDEICGFRHLYELFGRKRKKEKNNLM